MLNVIIMRGLMGSGKSTWAKAHVSIHKGYVIINKDSLRKMFYDEFDPVNDEGFVHVAMLVLIEAALIAKKNIIVDNMHLKDSQVREIEKLVARTAASIYEVQIVDFRSVPLETCLERNAARDRVVDPDVIRDFHERFIKDKVL